jgi:hypothetical protein
VKRRLTRAGVAIALLSGCSRQPTPAPSASAAPHAPESASAATPAPVRAGLSESTLRELVRKWAAAQSGNDFAGYEALYAVRFTGVKRAGSATTRLDRKGWMADRKTMIVPGLLVEASDVRVDVTPEAATVRFTQHYKSPHFEDVGPKQLVVISTAQGPRIAREEMLSSAIQLQGLGMPLVSRLHAAESSGIFLTDGLSVTAAKGELKAARPEYLGVTEVDADIDPAALTPEQRGFVGRSFTAYDASGKPCAAVVAGLSVRALLTPHFGVVQMYDDKTLYPDRQRAAKERTQNFFELAGDEGRYLFGRFATPCQGARWAIDGSAVPVVTPRPSDPGRTRALAAFHALPEYRAIETQFLAEHAEKRGTAWETYDGELAIATFHPPKGAPLLMIGARGGSGCGDFSGALTAVFTLTKPSEPTLRGIVDASSSVPHFLAAVDLDDDGELEFITGPDDESAAFELIHPGKKGSYARDTFFAAPFLDCPC